MIIDISRDLKEQITIYTLAIEKPDLEMQY